MATWICLLRAVNLGNHNKVSMPVLREALADEGFGAVRTYVQSGNIVLTSRHRSAVAVGDAVAAVVERSAGVRTPVIVRTPAQLDAVAAWDPFAAVSAAHPTRVHVMHLDDEPEPDRVEAFLAEDFAPDEVVVRGREAVLRYDEMAHTSRLQHALLSRRLGVDGTARNWRTLLALRDLANA